MKKTLLILIIALSIISGCQKQPVASFTSDKTTYVAGETIKLTNTTLDGYTYEWTLPNGNTSTTKDVDYKTADDSPDGSRTFTLKAYSKKGKKTDEAQQVVLVQAAKGTVTFWNCQSCAGVLPISVTVNGTTKSITQAYTTLPACGDAGSANFSLNVGTHSFFADDGFGTTWSGSVTVTKNGCTTFQLL